MNYEKEYKKLKADIEKAYLFAQTDSTKSVLEHILPELRESEDERARKEIIDFLQLPHQQFVGERKQEKWITWLEKQGKETSWKPSKEEMDVLYGLAYITNQYDEHKEEVITRLYQDLKREFFNGSSYENMFPNTEDDVRRRSTIQVLEYARTLDAYNQYGKADIDKNIAWLEKQELKSNPYSGVSFNYNGNTWGMCARDNGVDILFNRKLIQHISDEKQDEQELPIEKLPKEMKSIGESLGFTTQEECDEYNKMVSDLIMSDDNKGEKKQKSVGEEIVEALRTEYEKGRADAFAQMQKEWSEEDDMMIEETLYFLREYQQSNRCKDENGMQNSVSCEKWLKSLKDRVQLQPKQEKKP